MSTGCEFYDTELGAYAAGRLDPERRERLDAHLAECGDCRDELAVITMLRAVRPEPPADLEARIQRAVRASRGVAAARPRRPESAVPVHTPPAPTGRGGGRRWGGWRPWAVPLTAAAAIVAVWVGVRDPTDAGLEPVPVEEVLADADYEPYGAWPASDVVAGDPLLSDLSVEELESLLEEMER